MIKAFQLIFSPGPTWEKIALLKRHFAVVLLMYFIPFLLFCTAVESYGIYKLGERKSEIGKMVTVDQDRIIKYAVFQAATGLMLLVIGAIVLHAIAQSFNVYSGWNESVTTFAYGLSPLLLLRMLDGVPVVNTWVCWAIGIVLAMASLYHGVGIVLKPEQTKGFGVFLLTIFIMTVLSFLAHFGGVVFLRGQVQLFGS